MSTENQLTGQTLELYVRQLEADLATEPADATALLALMDTYDQGVLSRDLRFKQVLKSYLQTKTVKGGAVTGLTITLAGTGYVVGQQIPITGDGVGAYATVATIGGSGELLTVTMGSIGGNYTTATPDFTAAGNGDATGAAVLSYEPEAVVLAAIAAL